MGGGWGGCLLADDFNKFIQEMKRRKQFAQVRDELDSVADIVKFCTKNKLGRPRERRFLRSWPPAMLAAVSVLLRESLDPASPTDLAIAFAPGVGRGIQITTDEGDGPIHVVFLGPLDH